MQVFQAQGKKKSDFKLIELSSNLLHMFHLFSYCKQTNRSVIRNILVQHPIIHFIFLALSFLSFVPSSPAAPTPKQMEPTQQQTARPHHRYPDLHQQVIKLFEKLCTSLNFHSYTSKTPIFQKTCGFSLFSLLGTIARGIFYMFFRMNMQSQQTKIYFLKDQPLLTNYIK